MSRSTIRAAIADFLNAGITAGDLPMLTTVYPYPPKITAEGQFLPPDNVSQQSGAAVYIHLVSQDEQRIAIGGPTSGRKMVTYQVGLITYLLSVQTDVQKAGADNDTLLDGLVSYIRTNRTANSTAIFQWGEGNQAGAPDIHVIASMPLLLRLEASVTWSTLEVTALEIDVT